MMQIAGVDDDCEVLLPPTGSGNSTLLSVPPFFSAVNPGLIDPGLVDSRIVDPSPSHFSPLYVFPSNGLLPFSSAVNQSLVDPTLVDPSRLDLSESMFCQSKSP